MTMNEPLSSDKPRFVPAYYSDVDTVSVELTRETISEFLQWTAGVPISHRETIRRKIAKVANDDVLVMALCDELLALDDIDPARHFMLLSTLGETRNETAVPALEKLIWHERKTDRHKGPTPDCADVATTDLLVGLQARAVEMIAYIGGGSAHDALFEVLARHPAKSARIAAIDAYLFSQNDSDAAKEDLRAKVQPADAKFIGLPRFTGRSSRREFDARVADFYRSNPHECPPIPSTVSPRKRTDAWHTGIITRSDPEPQA
jgi:hypothetical protein